MRDDAIYKLLQGDLIGLLPIESYLTGVDDVAVLCAPVVAIQAFRFRAILTGIGVNLILCAPVIAVRLIRSDAVMLCDVVITAVRFARRMGLFWFRTHSRRVDS